MAMRCVLMHELMLLLYSSSGRRSCIAMMSACQPAFRLECMQDDLGRRLHASIRPPLLAS